MKSGRRRAPYPDGRQGGRAWRRATCWASMWAPPAPLPRRAASAPGPASARSSTSATGRAPCRPCCSWATTASVVVGEAAERRATSEPDHVVREFKRRIGDPTPVLVSGRPWAPEELAARLVQWVVERVAQREGGPATRLAVTHPASWGAHKKDLLGAALHRHGLPVTFLAEPQAAALHYAAAERVEPGSTIAVYDFGGGTFDAAVVHKDAQGFSLLGRPEGVERLGGIDLDELVFEHVVEGLPEAFDGLDENDPAVLSAVAAVRRECTEAKEALSADTEVSIPVLTPVGPGVGAAAPQRVRGDDPPARRGDGERAAPRHRLGRGGRRPAHGRAARRRLVADPARGPDGVRAARPSGGGGRRPEERDREGRGAVADARRGSRRPARTHPRRAATAAGRRAARRGRAPLRSPGRTRRGSRAAAAHRGVRRRGAPRPSPPPSG